MPASYTHHQFGLQVLNKIDDDTVKRIIENNLNYYYIGLQGPDLLFFYRPLKKNDVIKLGIQMHHDKATNFFKQAFKIIDQDEAKLAYILGFINHFILDSECHGYIERIVKEKNVSHFAIERDLDHRLIDHNGDKLNYYVATTWQINQQTAKTIAPFFNLDNKIIYSSLKSFKLLTSLFACKNNLKRNFLINGMKLVKADSYQAMVMQDKYDQRIVSNIDYLIDCYLEATNIATKEIVDYYYSFVEKTTISNRFDFNYE